MRRFLTAGVFILLAAAAPAQEAPLPKGDRKPVLLLDPGGPTAPVAALAFAPDGQAVYAGGLDKTIRVYRNRAGAWQADAPLRVPIGPGNAGAVNALAVSEDGRWLAAAGRGPMRDEAGFAVGGVVIAADRLPVEMRRDLGVIYLFDLANPAGGRVLRGHRAEVRALTFAAGTAAPVLISSAVEPAVEPAAGGKSTGVIRVWDVAAGEELAALAEGLPPSPQVGRVAGWATGAGKKDVTVAAAWPEPDARTPGKLRLWHVARGTVEARPDGALNIALAVLRDRAGKPEAVVSGGFAADATGRAQGRLTARPLAGGNETPIAFPRIGVQHQVPVAAASAGDRNLAVLLLRDPPAAGESGWPVDLVLVDRAGTVAARVSLSGVSPGTVPLLAASPNGDTLAVSGFRDHRVELYAVADLRAGRPRPVVLTGGPTGFDRVRFLDAGAAVGLATADGAEVIFDFANRTLGPAAAGRKPDEPAAVGVTFEKIPPAGDEARHAVRVTAPGRPAVVCQLIPGAVPTAWAYLPAKPLIAVAHDEPTQSKPLITLFDGATGRPLRQLTGHWQPVRGLAFSTAKPLLASVAGDGTTCVWSLKDIDRPTGAVEGLNLVKRDEALVVESRPAALGRLLAVGDVIEATGGEKPMPVTTNAEFVWRAAAITPGGTLAVRVRGKANPVILPVGRGEDERKPLFTVWVGPGGRDWVGWSPAGPYDVSGPEVEKTIGWLTNTGDPKTPTTFAAAGEYRDTYHRKDLLKFLAAEAELPAALDAWDDVFGPPVPRVAVRVPEAVGGVVRFGKATLGIDLENVRPDYPLSAAGLRYRVRPPGADAPEWTIAPSAGPQEIDLSNTAWKRGRYFVEVELLRRPGGPAVRREVASFLAVPPAPALEVTAGKLKIDANTPDGKRILKVEKPTAPIAVKATGYGRESVRITLHDGTAERAVTGPIDLPLKPGVNPIRVRGVPEGATAETRDAETAELSFTARYDPPMKDPPPTVGAISFAPAGVPYQLDGREVVAVDAAKVTASARIAAEHPLTAVRFAAGGGKPVALNAAGAKAFNARRELALKPGEPVRVEVTAATKNSDAAERAAVVAYLPLPPETKLTPLAASSITGPRLAVSGTFAPPAAGVPFSIRVVVTSPADPGAKPKEFEAKLDSAARTWAAEVELFPGPSRLSVIAKNQWRERVLTDAVEVAYRRPPRIVQPVRDADAGTSAVAAVTLTVETPTGLDPHEVLIDGRPVPKIDPKRLGETAGRMRWEVTVPNVPVKTEAGWKERLSVVVRNDDGVSEPVSVAVKRTAPPPVAPPPVAPPTITLGDVPRNEPTDAAFVAVPVRFTSNGPLRRVELWLRAGASDRYELVSGFKYGPPVKDRDRFTVTATADVPLAEGANRFRVVAVNEGGETMEPFTVTRVVPPVLVVVEGLDELNPARAVAADTLRPVASWPELRFPSAPAGLVAVRGYVRWANPAAPEVADPKLSVAVAVNGVNHLPAPLEPAANGVRRFKAPLFLNGLENVVRMELRAAGSNPRLPQDRAGRREFHVACAKPLTRQRLHVVVFGVDAEEGAAPELVERVIKALGGTPRGGRYEHGVFDAPGFERAVLYPPRVGEVQKGHVKEAMADVAQRIRTLAAAPEDGWVNDVILVYYQGRDWVDPRDRRRWLHTSQSLRFAEGAWKDFAVAVDELPESAGVRLLLLSVVGPGGPAGEARAPVGPVLRYAWSDPAAPPQVLTIFGQAFATEALFGNVVTALNRGYLGAPAAAGQPVGQKLDDIINRPFGRGGRP